MPDKHLPFMLPALLTSATSLTGRLNTMRLVEALIIAIATAFITMWGVQKQTEVQIDNLTNSVARMEKSEEASVCELRSQVKEVRQLVEQHILSRK